MYFVNGRLYLFRTMLKGANSGHKTPKRTQKVVCMKHFTYY